MKKVLIIDDHADFRSMIKMMLQYEGYDVIEAKDGQKDLDNPVSVYVDLIVTDLMMPEKEGLETIKEFRTKCPNAKIMALSGMDTYLKMALTMGADCSMAKPVLMEDFIGKVNEILA